ncbi:MAG: tetratricopeptide repeat protein [Bacteroidia bacterium]|nr:tetratricopeptide repeat protein [Bacteroidia bacterium]
MIRTLFTGIIFFAAALACNGQNSYVNNSLIKARYQLSEKLYAETLATMENQQQSGSYQMRSALTMGLALAGLRKYDESNKWLLQVSGESTAEASYCLAKNSLAVNDFPSAIRFLEKHLGCKDHFPEKQIRLDPAFSKLENSREWIHLWQTEWYSESEKQTAECEYLISQRQVDEARILDDQLLASHPNEPHAWFLLARICSLQKEDHASRQALERAWQLSSGNLGLKNDMLHYAIQTGLFEKANSMAGELILSDPTNPEYLIARALVRILDGKESLAQKEIETTEAAGIAPAELYYQAGRKFSSSMPQQAELYLTRAIDTGTMDARFYYARGTIRNTLDKTDLALGDLAMSLDIDPNQPELYFERAQIRLDKGDTEGACHDWSKALQMGKAKAADLLYKYCKLP